MGKDTSLIVRDPLPADEAAWRRLWAGYCAFYETEVPEAVTAGTWERMLSSDTPLLGRIAEWEGQPQGFTISIVHEGTWTLKPICYLEDLFVEPAVRGKGLGRALLDDITNLARTRGCSRLYWHTRAGNREARRLYDTFTEADDFVRYRLFLD
jgi:GNAT superfamily N-acetyltransferase